LEKENSLRQIHHGALVALGCIGVAAMTGCVSLDSPQLGGDCSKLGTLTLGQTLVDSVTTGSCRLTDLTYANFYTFAVDSQTRLTVTLHSRSQDAFTWLSDTTSLIKAITTATQSPDTVATMRLFLKAGSYRLAVNSYLSSPSGAFSVVTAPDTAPVRGCTPFWITSGVTTSQTITNADCKQGPLGTNYIYHLYLYMIPGGGHLNLTEHSTAFAPQVLVVSQSGAVVAYSATDTTHTNALVSYFPTAQDALLLFVGSSDTPGLGAYTLTTQ
jgi:hypothetical protein